LSLALLVLMRVMLRRSAGKLAMMDLVFIILIAGAAATKKPPRAKDAGWAGRCPGSGIVGSEGECPPHARNTHGAGQPDRAGAKRPGLPLNSRRSLP